MAYFKIGTVTHYYDKIGVAIIDLDSDIGIGDTVKFVRGGEDLFFQKIDSLQIEHEKAARAKKGDVIGIKTKEAVKAGAEVFRVESVI